VSLIFSGPRHRGKALAALVGLGLLAAAPAAQASHESSPSTAPASCTPQPAFAHPFASWGDNGVYTLVSGGDMESGLTGWTATGDVQVVEGNEPFAVGGASDHRSLAVGPGASIVTAPICIDDTYPWFRLFARNVGDANKSTLNVDVLYVDAGGRLREQGSGKYKTKSTDWQPTDTLDINVDFDKTGSPAALVSFRLSADNKSSWLLDDVYVDPMARG
jgi:hypothetical protein